MSRAGSSASSNVLSKIDPVISTVLDAIAIIIAEDYFSTCFEYARQSGANMSMTEKYKRVVNARLEELKKNNEKITEHYLKLIRDKYNTHNNDKITNDRIFEIICEFLTPGGGVTRERQFKLFLLMFQYGMDTVRDFIFDNIQLVINNNNDKDSMFKCANKIRKIAIKAFIDFQIIKLPEMRHTRSGAAPSGGGENSSMRSALLQITAELSQAKLRIKELEEENEGLKSDKIKLLNNIAEQRAHAVQSNPMDSFNMNVAAERPKNTFGFDFSRQSAPNISQQFQQPPQQFQQQPKQNQNQQQATVAAPVDNDDVFTFISENPYADETIDI